jgi:hypothetical protein
MKPTEKTLLAIIDIIHNGKMVSEREMLDYLFSVVSDYNKSTGRKVWNPDFRGFGRKSPQWRKHDTAEYYMLPNRVVLGVIKGNPDAREHYIRSG